jgi:transposase
VVQWSKAKGEIKMPKPLSQDIRELIIYHNKNGAKNTEIVKWLCVSKTSVERTLRIYREEKTTERKYYNSGRRPAFCEAKLNKIIEKIREQPDITLEEMIEQFHINISISALSRKLTKLDLTFKKRRYSVKSSSAQMCNGYAVNG